MDTEVRERCDDADLLHVIVETMGSYLETSDWREASSALLKGALRLTGSEYGFSGVVVDGPVLRILAHEGVRWDPTVNREFFAKAEEGYRRQGYLDFREFDNLFGRVILTKDPVTSNDPADDSRAGGLPPGHPPLKAFLGVPILKGTDVVGMVGVANRSGGYGDAERDRLMVLARMAGVLFNEYQRQERERALEEQLLQSQKMEAVGQLAGGVAHDFNNLLTVINGYSDLLLRKVEPGDPTRRHVEEIRKAGERASSLTRQLLAFSRRQVLQPIVMDLNGVLGEAAEMIRRLIGENILLVLKTARDLWRVRADRTQIEQVLVNLSVNARDAMAEGGDLIVETSNVQIAEPGDARYPGAAAGEYVGIRVTDTGRGMDAKTLSRIFEPFFTTKERGKGTGLGLSMVYGIVRQSGGHIVAESEEGLGATFRILLPRHGEAGRKATRRVCVDGKGAILLVEDEEGVRRLTSEMLREAGYEVYEAEDAESAIAESRGRLEEIGLLLTDVVMPGMNGPDLALRLRQDRPDLKVAYMSGYARDVLPNGGAQDSSFVLLEKPFTPEALIAKVRGLLGG